MAESLLNRTSGPSQMRLHHALTNRPPWGPSDHLERIDAVLGFPSGFRSRKASKRSIAYWVLGIPPMAMAIALGTRPPPLPAFREGERGSCGDGDVSEEEDMNEVILPFNRTNASSSAPPPPRISPSLLLRPGHISPSLRVQQPLSPEKMGNRSFRSMIFIS